MELFERVNICIAATAKSLQSCPTLCDPIDGSPPGSPVPGMLQARTLEWVYTIKKLHSPGPSRIPAALMGPTQSYNDPCTFLRRLPSVEKLMEGVQ